MGIQLLPQRGAAPHQFSAHICCGQIAVWIKMPLGMEVHVRYLISWWGLVFQFVLTKLRIITPRRSTTWVDAAYCHRPRSVVYRSVCRSDTLASLQKRLKRSRCRLRWELGWAQGSRIKLGSDPHGKGQFWGRKGANHCKV